MVSVTVTKTTMCVNMMEVIVVPEKTLIAGNVTDLNATVMRLEATSVQVV